jgi:hypothetical protein
MPSSIKAHEAGSGTPDVMPVKEAVLKGSSSEK